MSESDRQVRKPSELIGELLARDAAEADASANGAAPHFKQRGQEKLPNLILPSDDVGFEQCALKCFSHLAKTHRFFVRARTVVELVKSDGRTILEEVEPVAFRSRLENYFTLVKERKLSDGSKAIKPSRCSKDSAFALLKTTAAAELLAPIRVVTNSPIFFESSGKLEVLQKGYHPVSGGIYVLQNRRVSLLSLQEATKALLGLLADFNFVSPSDKSRAVASFLSPALRYGGLLEADFPLDIAEADTSQAGKTYRQKCACAIYGERPFVINRKEDSGVGSLDEAVSQGLVGGHPFLMLENIRGFIASQLLESAIRGEGAVNCRPAYSRGIQVQTDRICWLLSSNRADTTPDLANRSIITRIRKQPASYKFKIYQEGDLLAHIRAHADYYLSCIYTVLCTWCAKEKPRSGDTRHDFREWCQTLDWIIQSLFSLPPLLDGHRDEQQRISDPHLNWLRDLAIAVNQASRLDEGLRPGELVDLSASAGVSVPGCRPDTNDDQQQMQAGSILKRIFSDTRVINIGGFQVSHDERKEHDNERRKDVIRHYYWFENIPKYDCALRPCASSQ